MPYRKRGYRKRRRRVNGNRKPTQTIVQTSDQAKRLAGWIPWLLSNAMMIKKLMNTEKKYLDTTVSASVPSAGTIALLSGMSAGDDNNQRQGRSIKVLYVHANGSVYLNTLSTQAQIRVIVFSDSECNGAFPSVSDVLAQSNPVGQYNISSSIGRFRFIYDRLFIVDTAQRRIQPFVFTRQVNQRIKYEGTSSAIGSMGKNTLFFLYITDQTSNQPDIVTNIRIRYVDN